MCFFCCWNRFRFSEWWVSCMCRCQPQRSTWHFLCCRIVPNDSIHSDSQPASQFVEQPSKLIASKLMPIKESSLYNNHIIKLGNFLAKVSFKAACLQMFLPVLVGLFTCNASFSICFRGPKKKPPTTKCLSS